MLILGMSFLILNIDFETLHFQYWFWFLILKLPCTVFKPTWNSQMHTNAYLNFIDFDFESWFWLVEISRFLILILNSDIFSRIFFLILILTLSLSFQEFWFWYWIFLHLFNKIDFGFEIFYTFQKSWYWFWLCCKYFKNFDIDIESLQFFFKNVDIDFDCFLPISTILILILIFSRDFKILDLDIEAKKPFLPISATYYLNMS